MDSADSESKSVEPITGCRNASDGKAPTGSESLQSPAGGLSENEQAYVLLREDRQELQAIYDGVLEGILIADRRTKKFLKANSAICRMLGYSEVELLDMSVPDIHPAEAVPHVLEQFDALVEGRYGVAREVPFLRKNESLFHADVAVRVGMIRRRGRNCIIGFINDVSERKRAAEGLEESEERFRAVFEQAADGIVVVDADGLRIVQFNDAAHQSLGYTREEFGRLGLPDVDAVDTSEGVARRIERILRQKTDRFETRHKTKQGEIRDVLVSAEVLSLGATPLIAAIWQDITDRKRAEGDRDKLIAQLEAKNDELERFTYTVSHDLKSPLLTIKGYLGLLREDLHRGDSQMVEDDMKRILMAAGKMEQLLRELLELSRIGRQVGPPEEVPLSQLAQEAADLVGGQILQGGVEVEIAPDMPVVCGDRQRLLEVLQNLIENAVKYMGDQPRPRIEIGIRLSRDSVICYVHDNGIGIDPRYQDEIFALFSKLDKHSKGTGVGLALAKRIIEVHGGQIWVESEGLGKGTTFCFSLRPGVNNLNIEAF